MRHSVLLFVLIVCSFFLGLRSFASIPNSYKNAALSPDKRAELLLKQMTLDEKIGQLLCPLGWEMYDKQDAAHIEPSMKFKAMMTKQHVGMFWATFRADPWTRKTLETGLSPHQAALAANKLQRYAVDSTRLGIPLFFAEEAAHGHMAIGKTVFPTALGQASTWDAPLIEKMAKAISVELRSQGAQVAYGPILDLAREPRWSRVEETYGEDPVLVGCMGKSFVTGLNSKHLADPYASIATLKHFIAYGVPDGGHNGNGNSIGARDLLDTYLPPFHKAIDAGALSLMSSYNSVDGIPCTANEELLTGLLRRQWGFSGFVVSDLGAIEGLVGSHHVAANVADAAIQAISAGVDSDLGGNAYTTLIASVRNGAIKQAVIDSAVCRILKLKFAMGLFEHPYVDVNKVDANTHSAEHVALARRVANESVVLLKNEDNILPLSSSLKDIAVIGPNADNMYNQLGDYTAPQAHVSTLLQGITKRFASAHIHYVKGCAIRDTLHTDLNAAVAAAKKSQVAIVVVGGSSARDFKTKYMDTGAAVTDKNAVSDMECGEGYDRSTLTLLGRQLDLLKAIYCTGTPMVVVYVEGRPLNMNFAAKHAKALLTAWYPGEEGGDAVADILSGAVDPAGRLPVSIPKSVGQLPVYYDQKNPTNQDYVEIDHKPLYPFGFGLSYTHFAYSGLKISETGNYEVRVEFDVRNDGQRDGDEVSQLYLRDVVASTSQPIQQLKKFERFFLKVGQAKHIVFILKKEDLTVVNRTMKTVVEPGNFNVMIGSSSDRITLKGSFDIK